MLLILRGHIRESFKTPQLYNLIKSDNTSEAQKFLKENPEYINIINIKYKFSISI